MPIKYIGRTTDFRGKTLWEIVGNLKNFGVGRFVARNMHERYPERSFAKILKVEALPNEDPRKVRVVVERTFRGRTYEKPVTIESTSYKADYKLIPKDEEASYCRVDSVRPVKVLPTTLDFPPLLKEMYFREAKAKGLAVSEDPKLVLRYNKSKHNHNYKISTADTPATVKHSLGIGDTPSPNLYANIKKYPLTDSDTL